MHLYDNSEQESSHRKIRYSERGLPYFIRRKNCAVVNLSEIGNAIKKVLVKFKLSGRYFALCETGRMLIISANMSGSLSCHTCLTMNAIAQSICRNNL
jgi:hypothetical protein